MCGIIQREWHEVEAIYEKAGRKPFQSCNAEIKIYIVCENILFYMCKRYRMPALKDRICWNLKLKVKVEPCRCTLKTV